jgi:hypothetical protein
MGGDGEYEPKDSRNVTGTAATPDGHWSGERPRPGGHRGEYEPRDSRNVTGTASTPDGRWTNVEGRPPLADGGHEEPRDEEDEDEEYDDEDDDIVEFEPAPELDEMLRKRLAH